MRYRLKQSLCLRSWKGLPAVVLDAEQGRLWPLTPEEFACLELCDGSIDFDVPLLPDGLGDVTGFLLKRGLIEPWECREGTSAIDPVQSYRRYGNRYVADIHWSITSRCNYHCKHCLMDAGSQGVSSEPSFGAIEEIIDQIVACGIPAVSLTGGEPLVREDFLDIVALLSTHGIRLSTLYTNGSLVTEHFLDELERFGQRPTFVISFDGVGCHDWLRGIEGAEEATERAIRLLASRGMNVSVTYTLHSGNAEHILDTALALAGWGATSMRVSAMYDEGRWKQQSVPRAKDEGWGQYTESEANGTVCRKQHSEPIVHESGHWKLHSEPQANDDGPADSDSQGPHGARYRSITTEELARSLLAVIPGYCEAGRVQGELPLQYVRLGPLLALDAKHPKDFSIPIERQWDNPASYRLIAGERLEPYLSVEGRLMPSMVLAGTEFASYLEEQPFPLLTQTPLTEVLTESPFLEYLGLTAEDYFQANPTCADCPHAKTCVGGFRYRALLLNPDNPLAPDPVACELFRGRWVDQTRAIATEATRDL